MLPPASELASSATRCWRIGDGPARRGTPRRPSRRTRPGGDCFQNGNGSNGGAPSIIASGARRDRLGHFALVAERLAESMAVRFGHHPVASRNSMGSIRPHRTRWPNLGQIWPNTRRRHGAPSAVSRSPGADPKPRSSRPPRPDTAPSPAVPWTASTCSRQPIPTPQDPMISSPCGWLWRRGRQ
jgi:hypothetical protein